MSRLEPPRVSRRSFLSLASIGSCFAAMGVALAGALRLPRPTVMPMLTQATSASAQTQSSQLQFVVTLDPTTEPARTITNTANLAWTSLPGDVTTAGSPYNMLSTERTGDASNPGGAYQAGKSAHWDTGVYAAFATSPGRARAAGASGCRSEASGQALTDPVSETTGRRC